MKCPNTSDADNSGPHIWDSISLCCPLEEEDVSIQIVNPGAPGARAEVVERLCGVLSSLKTTLYDADPIKGTEADSYQKYAEEVKTFFFALVGGYPTSEELKQMLGS